MLFYCHSQIKMNRENKFRIILILFLGILFVLAWMIFLFFGINYFLLFMFAVFLFFVLVFLELYFRIQHNIDKSIGSALSKQKSFYEELLDFFDILLSQLEKTKNENEEKFHEQKDMHKRMAAGFEDMFNSSHEQIDELKKHIEDKINLVEKEISEKKSIRGNIKKTK